MAPSELGTNAPLQTHWCTLSCTSRPAPLWMTESACGPPTICHKMIGASPYDAAGYHVLKVETHLHTLHSDGQHGIREMFEACRGAGYAAVALTDHNTQSGIGEARDIAAELGLVLVPG